MTSHRLSVLPIQWMKFLALKEVGKGVHRFQSRPVQDLEQPGITSQMAHPVLNLFIPKFDK